MTKDKRIQEIEHIKDMIKNVSVDDLNTLKGKEINTRVFWTCLPDEAEYALDVGYGCPNFILSIDAQKQLERDGWRISVNQFEDNWICYIYGDNKPYYGVTLPTEVLARLYCWLCVMKWEIENG